MARTPNNPARCSVWCDTAVKAGVPGDACLATGYDRKHLTISHGGRGPVTFSVQADFTGTGTWTEVVKHTVSPDKPLEYRFPDAFGAYWLRIIPDGDTTATATLFYD